MASSARFASQHNIQRTPEGSTSLPAGVSITGPAALSADGKKTASDYLACAYAGYHIPNSSS
jgi:hypothetical protein